VVVHVVSRVVMSEKRHKANRRTHDDEVARWPSSFIRTITVGSGI